MATLTRENVVVLDRAVTGFNGTVWHIQVGVNFYLVSAISEAFDTGRPETMVFASDADAEVMSWFDLAVVSGQDHEAAIEKLLETF